MDVIYTNKYLYYKIVKTQVNNETNNLKNSIRIIKSYNNTETGNWYRLYSDGWVDQGGTNNTYNINFLVTFSNTKNIH